MQVLDPQNFLRGAAGAALFGGFFTALLAACGDGELDDGEVITSWACMPRARAETRARSARRASSARPGQGRGRNLKGRGRRRLLDRCHLNLCRAPRLP
jgi:hypothetical protein